MTNNKKLTTELQDLITQYGYWSKEVENFNSKLPYDKMIKINTQVKR